MIAGARRGSAAVSLAAALFACGDKTSFVAIEPNADADLRVAITIPGGGVKQIRVLARDEPLVYPLHEVFSRDGRDLRVVIVALARAELDRAYPALKNRALEEVKNLLRPAFGAPEPGGYPIPKPLRILTARIASSGPADVIYKEVSATELQADTEARFVFKLPPEIACAPGENALRIFARRDPSRVCAFQRDATCTWLRQPDMPCPHLADIFGRPVDANMRLFEAPPGTLRGQGSDPSCVQTADRELGESRRFDCGAGSLISVQETPRAVNDAPWVPVRKGSTRSFGAGGVFVEAKRGSLYAYAMDGVVLLSRMTVLATGELDPYDVRYQIPGAGPRLRVTGVGMLQRLSTNSRRDMVVVDGTAGTAILIKDDNVGADNNELPSFYKFPIDVPASVNPVASRTGHVVAASGTTLLALVQNGIAALALAGAVVTKTAETPPGVVSFTRDDEPKIVVVKKRGEDRAIVWLKDGRLFVFDASGAIKLSGCRLEGKIMTATDNMMLVRRPAGERFILELLDLAQAEDAGVCTTSAVRYFVPPNSQNVTGTIELDVDAFTSSNNRTFLRYQYDRDAGLLDIGTGLSQAIPLPAASQISLLFEDQGGIGIWGLFAPRDRPTFDQVAIPILKTPPP